MRRHGLCPGAAIGPGTTTPTACGQASPRRGGLGEPVTAAGPDGSHDLLVTWRGVLARPANAGKPRCSSVAYLQRASATLPHAPASVWPCEWASAPCASAWTPRWAPRYPQPREDQTACESGSVPPTVWPPGPGSRESRAVVEACRGTTPRGERLPHGYRRAAGRGRPPRLRQRCCQPPPLTATQAPVATRQVARGPGAGRGTTPPRRRRRW